MNVFDFLTMLSKKESIVIRNVAHFEKGIVWQIFNDNEEIHAEHPDIYQAIIQFTKKYIDHLLQQELRTTYGQEDIDA